MATLHGTITGVHGIVTPAGPAMDSAGNFIEGAYLTVNWSGTYVQANDADILLVPAAIESFLHDGRTITLLQACFAAPGNEAGTPIGCGACTISTTTISTSLTGGDLITEHAGALLGAMTAPVHVYVTYNAI